MTWLAPRLRERIQIREADQDANDDGGFDQTYSTLLTIWAELKEINFVGRGSEAVGGEQVNEAITHNFTIRRIAVSTLGTNYASGFDTDFDIIADLTNLKTSYYIFVQRSSTTKGRLFRIRSVKDVGERREYLTVGCEEIEEQGTGYPA